MSTKPLPIYSLPLFPLHCVLFPQFPVQLQIFEPRYHAMIEECLRNNRSFGVVLIRAGEEAGRPATPHDVGCVARILDTRRMPDGRLHVIAAGERRFRLLDYAEADEPYLVGQVEAVEDEPIPSRSLPGRTRTAKDLFVRYITVLAEIVAERSHIELPDLALPEDPAELSFCIGAVAHMALPDKQ